MIGVASYIAYRSDGRRAARLTAELPATITEVYVSRDRNNEEARPGRINGVRVTYQYSISGRSYTRTSSFGRNVGMNFREGGAAKVCYNPENPEEAELSEMNRLCER